MEKAQDRCRSSFIKESIRGVVIFLLSGSIHKPDMTLARFVDENTAEINKTQAAIPAIPVERKII